MFFKSKTAKHVVEKLAPHTPVHVLWITAGLSCDGDSVSLTAAEQPSIEDVLMNAIPGLPKGSSAQSRARL